MRYILPFLVLLATGCSGQQDSERRVKIDTAKLFNPNPQSDEVGASEVNIFKRNIVLTQPEYYGVFNDKEYKLETLDKVKEFIKSNKQEIQKNKFYIITDSSTSFKKTISIINIFRENQITNYKVINYQQYFTPAEPVTIQAPTPVETITRLTDSAYFSIQVLDKAIYVKLNGMETKLKNSDDLDLFIASHKSEIKEVLITVTKGLPYNEFKPIPEVLKKHGIYKYNLVTE
jgi:biopolymer transport protein ExbD